MLELIDMRIHVCMDICVHVRTYACMYACMEGLDGPSCDAGLKQLLDRLILEDSLWEPDAAEVGTNVGQDVAVHTSLFTSQQGLRAELGQDGLKVFHLPCICLIGSLLIQGAQLVPHSIGRSLLSRGPAIGYIRSRRHASVKRM